MRVCVLVQKPESFGEPQLVGLWRTAYGPVQFIPGFAVVKENAYDILIPIAPGAATFSLKPDVKFKATKNDPEPRPLIWQTGLPILFRGGNVIIVSSGTVWYMATHYTSPQPEHGGQNDNGPGRLVGDVTDSHVLLPSGLSKAA